MSRRVAVLALGLLVGSAGGLAGQDGLRAGLVDDPRIGRAAPDFSLPYHTAAGPGPLDQPFRLGAELGRVVVLVFADTPTDPAARKVFEYFAANDTVLFNAATQVVGVFRTRSGPVQELAQVLAGRFKFLPDSLGRAFRRFGVGSGASQPAVFVVGYDGRLVYRSRPFDLEGPQGFEALRRAVKEGAG
jgi:peroxiredoxin